MFMLAKIKLAETDRE